MRQVNWLRNAVMAIAVGAAVAACAPMQGRETAGEYVDDTAITAKIKAELVRDKELPATQIRVETLQNVVQLSGFVDNAAQKSKAAQVARQIQGVKDVKNDIVVR
jgi:hyperosmotically inducible periplasmic protein